MQESKRLHIVADTAGARLDKFISERFPDVSRSQAQHFIDDGNVRVNGKPEKASYRIIAGDAVEIEIAAARPGHLVPEEIPVPVIYEDDDVLVVDKPAGLTVHPAPGHKTGTLVNAVMSHLIELEDEDDRPGIVHRLDKDTSGVMVIAKNTVALAKLSEQFKSHTITKVYIALVQGHLTPEQGIIEAHIGRDTGDRKKMAIADENRGREARTRYRVLKYIGNYSLLEVKPETGRTHQIRVHLAAIGHPVVGDATYGIKNQVLARQFLHAQRLGFYHPATGEYKEFTLELPPDLKETLERLG
ncbi:MAG TPA: RluA family pseudouridine synthase [Dehalococcoidales bacterium]|nr:RluA family pseudouridine synthase [Dehalococcoidales bacterium]